MNFLKKLFTQKQRVDEGATTIQSAISDLPTDLPLDDIFVQNFIQKGGKFLYCTHQ